MSQPPGDAVFPSKVERKLKLPESIPTTGFDNRRIKEKQPGCGDIFEICVISILSPIFAYFPLFSDGHPAADGGKVESGFLDRLASDLLPEADVKANLRSVEIDNGGEFRG